MALSIIEQLKMIKDENPQEATFLALIHQTAVDKSKDWYDTKKDVSGNAEATSYASKYSQIISKLVNADNSTLRSVKQMLVSILGDTSTTFAQVQSANDSAWSAFTDANIIKAIEYVAGISHDEKTAYINL